MTDPSDTKTAITVTMLAEAVAVVYDIRWLVVLVAVLVIADFWFGISDSRKRKEKVRFSYACRRTANKLVDYLTYLLVGVLLGMGLFEPLGVCSHVTSASVALVIPAVCEVSSIFGHFCSVHELKLKFDWKKFAVVLIKKKSEDVGEAVEEAIE